MRPHLVFLILFATSRMGFAADELKKCETWITGDVFIRHDVLMFRANKPVQGNTTGNVVLLGATRETYKVMFPVYVRAAERHTKVRLYGVLFPVTDSKDPKSPSVQFIAWKLHLPSDPDELAPHDKIIIGPDDTISGNKILLHPKK